MYRTCSTKRVKELYNLFPMPALFPNVTRFRASPLRGTPKRRCLKLHASDIDVYSQTVSWSAREQGGGGVSLLLGKGDKRRVAIMWHRPGIGRRGRAGKSKYRERQCAVVGISIRLVATATATTKNKDPLWVLLVAPASQPASTSSSSSSISNSLPHSRRCLIASWASIYPWCHQRNSSGSVAHAGTGQERGGSVYREMGRLELLGNEGGETTGVEGEFRLSPGLVPTHSVSVVTKSS